MPLRRFICNVVGDGTVSDLGSNVFRAAIAPLLDANNIEYSVRDLRSWTEQQALSGSMLITCDVPDTLLPALRAAAVRLVDVETMTRQDVDDLFGSAGSGISNIRERLEQIGRLGDQSRRERLR